MGDLLGPAAGQQRHDGPLRVEAEARHESPLVRRRVHEVHEGMSNERHRDARLAIQRLFEREDDQHVIHGLADRVQPSAPPGPDLRRDVVDDAHSSAAEVAREPEVEVGIVDEHGHVGELPVDLGQYAVEHPPQRPQMRDDLQQADDGQVLDVRQQLCALGGQPVAPEAEDLDPGLTQAELADELSCIEVAGGLAAGEKDAHGGAPVYRCPLGAPRGPDHCLFPWTGDSPSRSPRS